MSTPDDVLGWIRPPLEELKRDYNADPGKPWEERREFFLRQLGLQDARQDPVVQELLERLDEAPEEERNSILGSDELDSMADEIVRQHAPVQEEAGDETAYAEARDETAYDEQAWQAYLAQNGPQWDGTEESWEQFRQWFAYYASEQGLGVPATAFLDYLTPQPPAERIATFAQYGVTITPAPGAAGDGAAYDEQAWQAYLAQNGPQWDGTEESWEQFRQWFANYASEQGLGAPATELLDYLAAQPAAERIATFAQYGVTITPPQEAAAQQPAAAEQGGQETEWPVADEVSAEEMDSITGDALKAHPEFADMSEEEGMRVISEVLDELEAG
jgi:hypothetical protein